MLPERDLKFLAEHCPGHRLEQHSGQIAVVLPDYALPLGFTPSRVELLLVIPFGYPDAPLDMFWLSPAVTTNGAVPAATSEDTQISRTWQRFSRHLPPGVWRPGVDGLQSYLALVGTMLTREAEPRAAAA